MIAVNIIVATFLLVVIVISIRDNRINKDRYLYLSLFMAAIAAVIFIVGYIIILFRPELQPEIARRVFRPIVPLMLMSLSLYILRWRQTNLFFINFVANVSHELRTPVAIIYGMIEYLNDGLLPEHVSQSEIWQAVRRKAGILKFIVENILSHRRMTPVIRNENIVVTIKQALKPLQLLHSNAVITFVISDKCPAVVIVPHDPVLLTLVINNLVNNAVKFVADGTTPQVEVTFFCTPSGYQISVCDNGIGISKKDIKKIFRPFVQLSTGTTRKYGGVGLGLSVVRDIVYYHGWKIKVESEPGKGTCFHIMIKGSKQK